MHPILRVIVGVVTGIIVSFIIVAAVEICSIKIFPLPPGTNMMDPASVKAAMASVPDGARVLVVVGWFFGALVGTFLTVKISRSAAQGVIVGAILLTMAILNMLSLPHPAWMWAAAIVAYVVATWLGTKLGAPKGGAAATATAA
jgi:hypothetical protein